MDEITKARIARMRRSFLMRHHLESIHQRHHDTEQHHVEQMCRGMIQGFGAVARLLEGVSRAFAAPGQYMPVASIVIHDELARPEGAWSRTRGTSSAGSGEWLNKRSRDAAAVRILCKSSAQSSGTAASGLLRSRSTAAFDALDAGRIFSNNPLRFASHLRSTVPD
jgi:hypothetical protein